MENFKGGSGVMVERKYTVTLKNGTIREVVREEKERHSAIGLWRYMLK